MDKVLYIGMSGAKQNMLAQQAHANNLANVNTVGFKQDLEQARSMPVFGEHFPSRAYAMTERPGTLFDSGSLMETGGDLDIAVRGSGWIGVQASDGGEAFTRAGDLKIDVNGLLRNGAGYQVMGNGGPIAIPPADKVQIGKDGTISIVPAGGPPDQLVELDRIKLVNPPAAALEKGPDGLIRRKADQALRGPEVADAAVQLEPGFLENSNVNPVDSLMQTMSLARQYEVQVKVMSTADENSQIAARLLQDL